MLTRGKTQHLLNLALTGERPGDFYAPLNFLLMKPSYIGIDNVSKKKKDLNTLISGKRQDLIYLAWVEDLIYLACFNGEDLVVNPLL